MRDSLESKASPFDGLHRQQISVLLRLLEESELAEMEYIKRRYGEVAPEFDITLHFLTTVGAVLNDDGNLAIAPELRASLERVPLGDLVPMLLDLTLRSENRFRSELLAYLKRYRVVEGRAVHRPSVEHRSAESGVRNFLMELGIVAYDSRATHYVLSAEHSFLYAQARGAFRVVPPMVLERNQREKHDLGLAAEIAVLSCERRRLGVELADRIDHVSLRNAAAGYDIQSLSVIARDTHVPRFIEVKAVPAATFRFYWTSNEIDVAKQFGSWYYLYLLPVDRSGVFDLESLRIIRDPHSAVLGSASDWITETGVTLCRLAAAFEPRSLA